MTAAIVNQEMAEAWDREAEGWLAHADRYERAGRRHWEHMLGRLNVASDERVLDVGCGAGGSTLDVARQATDGEVVGLDISVRMVDHARRAAETAGIDNVTFVCGDAQVHPFADAHFDLAISVFGTMFFADPAAAFANIARATRPGGRLAVIVWRELARNEWLTAIRGALALGRDLPDPPPGAPGPFAQAQPERVTEILGGAGFASAEFGAVDVPMDFGRDADDAYTFLQTFGITKGLTETLGDDERRRAMDALLAVVDEHETPEGVLFGTSAWLITATRGE